MTAVIVAASLNVGFLRGCDYGNDKESYDNICDGDDDPTKGLIPKIWVPCAIGACITLLTLICGTYGGKTDDDDNVVELPKPLHMTVPINYVLLFMFTFFTSVIVSKISLAAQASAPGVVFEAVALTSAAVLGITIFAFTNLRGKDSGIYEMSYIAPGLSAIGLVFAVAAFFVFGPSEKLGCDKDDEGKCKP